MPSNHHHYSLSLVCHSSSQFMATQNTSPRTVCLLNIIIVGCYSHSPTTHSWRLVDHGQDAQLLHAWLTLGLALLVDYQHWYDDESKGTCSLHPDFTQLHSLPAQIVSFFDPILRLCKIINGGDAPYRTVGMPRTVSLISVHSLGGGAQSISQTEPELCLNFVQKLNKKVERWLAQKCDAI